MPPKKKGRITRAKPKIVSLTPEEQQRRDQVDLFLKDLDKHVEMTIKEAWRDVETISASINTLYKLELLKLPQEVKDMKWDDYYKQSLEKGQNPLALSEAISSCMDDSLCATVDTQVSQLKSAMKTSGKKRGKKRTNSEDQPPPSASRSSSRKRASNKTSSDVSNTETPANTRKTRGNKNPELTTPANTRAPPKMGKTPQITPKFDTQSLSRTVSRVARKNEVLVSLSGSPVVGVTSRAAKAEADQAVLVPIGNGKTLSVPVGQNLSNVVDHLDQEQINKLEELQKSLANILQSRHEAEN